MSSTPYQITVRRIRRLVDREAQSISVELDGYITSGEYDIRAGFSSALGSGHSIYNYSGTDISNIEIWDSPGLNTKLYEKEFTYDLFGRVETVITTDLVEGKVLSKVFTYSGNDLVSNEPHR